MGGASGGGLLFVTVAVALATACSEQRLTEADCARVRARLEQAWNRDAVAAQRLADTDELTRFIGDEQRRLGAGWDERCRALVGRPVAARDLGCLEAAQTIDDVLECGR